MFSVNAISPVQFTDKQWTNKDNWLENILYQTGRLVLLSKALNQLQTKARTESNMYQAALCTATLSRKTKENS